MNLYDWSRDHPLSVLMAWGALLLFGILSFFELEMEELPEAASTVITVVSELPGFPAEEIESLITIPMENTLSGIRYIKDMESVSKRGYSRVLLHFDWGADMYQSSISVRECIDGLYPYLPRGMKKPLVMSNDLAGDPVIMLAVKALENNDEKDFYSILNSEIKNRLQGLDEIAYVSIRGLKKPEIHVELDMDALSVRGISIAETASALSSFLIKKTAGKITDRGIQRLVTVESGINTAAEIEELQLFPGIRLKDIAEIKEESEQQGSIFLSNGELAWGFCIYKNASSGTAKAADAVKNILPLLKDEYSGRLGFQIIDDESVRIKKNISSLFLSLFWGLTGAFLVLLLLYRQLSPALITAASIPFTLILNFFFLYIFKISLNTISLYGMIAAIGLIADNSIIVLHELEKGEDIQNINSALFTSTLTTVIVFLPPLFIPGPTSVLFGDLVLTVVFTVGLSLPVSLFFTPACYRLLNKKLTVSYVPLHVNPPSSHCNKVKSCYFKVLNTFLSQGRFSAKALYIFILIFLSGMVLLKVIPFELFPDRQSNKLLLSLSLPPAYSPGRVIAEASSISTKIQAEFPLNTIIMESEGSDRNNFSFSSSNMNIGDSNQLNILIINEKRISPEMKKAIHNFCRNTLYLQNCRVEPLPGTFQKLYPEDKGISLASIDSDTLYELPLPPGTSESGDSKMELYYLETDPQRLIASNISPLTIHTELTARINGLSAGEVERAKDKINILVRAAERYRSDFSSLSRMITAETAAPLDLLGKFMKSSHRDAFYRKNQQYIRSISSIRTEDKGVLEEELKSYLPPEISILKDEETEMHQLTYLYALSLVFLFLILGVQTGSLRKTLILYSSLVPAIWGGLIFLLIFRQSLNIYSFLGLLILQGTIVNSGILLLSSLDGSFKQGRSIQQGAACRLKPLSGSCLSTVTALIPVLITALLSENGEAGMALSLIGGLLFGTMLVLILLPAFYQNLVLLNGK
ncbi:MULTISPECIES: efflux RND transporter permease subunit [unclassified Oceanispirochaeta]|uniref:efflux RND transporter permease subunit n=1 Tax=unclassified Oceanispirochaeta TaxID=2635722 RepID=UPI0011C06660|nr:MULTISPECIES: efflux RND transporter permease subunit [unclassified Oceanispirochaeta]MBF9017297.1 efflux RND transporter permease subunit [Oceanispirochaeta sp. M2]NPD73807.1 efflux RND transporter permease subunit [Oceanispirochaeta sp. M1]